MLKLLSVTSFSEFCANSRILEEKSKYAIFRVSALIFKTTFLLNEMSQRHEIFGVELQIFSNLTRLCTLDIVSFAKLSFLAPSTEAPKYRHDFEILCEKLLISLLLD